jgi:hypothetical protein
MSANVVFSNESLRTQWSFRDVIALALGSGVAIVWRAWEASWGWKSSLCASGPISGR